MPPVTDRPEGRGNLTTVNHAPEILVGSELGSYTRAGASPRTPVIINWCNLLQFKVLGPPAVERDGALTAGRTTQRRRLALLALLSVARERGVSRDRLMAYLWPEHDSGHARHSLSQLVYAIRQDLGDVIHGGADLLRLDPAAIETDIDEFEEAARTGDARSAVLLYTGPFLDGFTLDDSPEFESWMVRERRRLAAAFADALASLAARASRDGRHLEAVGLWRRRADLDLTDTDTTIGLMKSLRAVGDHGGALAAAREHASAVRSEFAVEPAPRLQELTASIEMDQARVSAPTVRPAAAPLPRVRMRRIAFAGVALGVAAAAVAIGSRETAPTYASRVVVLGIVPGSDSSLARTVREALRTKLEGGRGIRVLGDAPVRETLRQMRMPFDGWLSGEIALEVARRRGADAVVTAAVARTGDQVRLLIRVYDPSAATTVGAFSTESPLETLLAKVAALGEQVRGRLGAASRLGATLPALTTRSYEALEQYALAREAYSKGDRIRAMRLAGAALEHDSMLAMAHYLLGEVYWFEDRQSLSDAHLTRAYQFSSELPARERLVITARYQQLVLDRPDSALPYWIELARIHPEEPLAFEGRSWSYRALGRHAEMSAAADSALQLDSSAVWPNVSHLLSGMAGDTTRQLAMARRLERLVPGIEAEARFGVMLRRGDFVSALARFDSINPPGTTSSADFVSPRRQPLLLALGRLDEARAEMKTALRGNLAQAAPRVLIAQARADLTAGGPPTASSAMAVQAVDWVEHADLSPPAIARLLERAAEVGARAGDLALIGHIRALLLAHDRGRGLRSYRLALAATEACEAWARGDFVAAAAGARRARAETYFGRSLWTWLMLEADARHLAGERATADSLYRVVLDGHLPGDADGEVWIMVRPAAVKALATARQ
jgi:DNA-binding SARP family transcriptional activator